MVAVNSTMLPLGTLAPAFSLPDARDGSLVALNSPQFEVVGDVKGYVVAFICNHCPFVVHIRARLVELLSEYQKKGIMVFAISSNDVTLYPDDAPEKMKDVSEAEGFTFPYLYDENQSVAKAYRAACTPDFYVFNHNKALVYRGQFDDSRPTNRLCVTGKDLRNALEAVITGKSIPEQHQKPSIGCNIKWKKGSAPEYFDV